MPKYLVIEDRLYGTENGNYKEAIRLAERRAEKGIPCIVVEVKAEVRLSPPPKEVKQVVNVTEL